MAGYSGPNVTDDGLVLSLGGANNKSFKGEATTNEFVDDTWWGDGTNQTGLTKGATLVTNKNLKYKNYTTYLWTPGSSRNCYLNGADISSSRTSTVWTFSCYVKREDGAAITSLNVYMYYPGGDGSASGTIESVGNGWYRVSRTRTGTDNYIGLAGFTGFTSGYRYYLSAPQLEKKSYATTPVEINSTRGTTVGAGGGWKNLTGSSDGELVNGVRESDDGGGSLVFDGTNDYVSIGYDLSWTSSSSASISLWIKPNSLSSSYYPFIGKTNWEWQLMQKNTSLEFVCWNTGGSHSNGPIPTITNFFTSVNDFVNLSLVWNHSDNKYYFYRNGILVNTTTWTNSSINQNRTEGIKIGGGIYQWSTSGSYWTGKISNTQIYNRALTESEVKKNFNSLRGRFGI